MKANKTYSGPAEFNRKHPYVTIETPYFHGKKYAPAQIFGNYTSKKQAEKSDTGRVMTRKAAEKFIKRWNNELNVGILSINF